MPLRAHFEIVWGTPLKCSSNGDGRRTCMDGSQLYLPSTFSKIENLTESIFVSCSKLIQLYMNILLYVRLFRMRCYDEFLKENP